VKDYPRSRPRPTRHLGLLYFFLRVQLPALRFARQAFDTHLTRAFGVYLPKAGKSVTWPEYFGESLPARLGGVRRLPGGSNAAWDMLFAARTGRSDSLLVDALRARAARLYPRTRRSRRRGDGVWSHLLVPDGEGRCRCSADMTGNGRSPLADPRLSEPAPEPPPEAPRPASPAGRRHRGAAAESHQGRRPLAPGVHPRRPGLAGRRADGERILLGLRWRYK